MKRYNFILYFLMISTVGEIKVERTGTLWRTYYSFLSFINSEYSVEVYDDGNNPTLPRNLKMSLFPHKQKISLNFESPYDLPAETLSMIYPYVKNDLDKLNIHYMQGGKVNVITIHANRTFEFSSDFYKESTHSEFWSTDVANQYIKHILDNTFKYLKSIGFITADLVENLPSGGTGNNAGRLKHIHESLQNNWISKFDDTLYDVKVSIGWLSMLGLNRGQVALEDLEIDDWKGLSETNLNSYIEKLCGMDPLTCDPEVIKTKSSEEKFIEISNIQKRVKMIKRLSKNLQYVAKGDVPISAVSEIKNVREYLQFCKNIGFFTYETTLSEIEGAADADKIKTIKQMLRDVWHNASENYRNNPITINSENHDLNDLLIDDFSTLTNSQFEVIVALDPFHKDNLKTDEEKLALINRVRFMRGLSKKIETLLSAKDSSTNVDSSTETSESNDGETSGDGTSESNSSDGTSDDSTPESANDSISETDNSDQTSGGGTSNNSDQTSGGGTSNNSDQTSGGGTSNNSDQTSGSGTSNNSDQTSGGGTSNNSDQASGSGTSNNSDQTSGGGTSSDQTSGGGTSSDQTSSGGTSNSNSQP